MNWNWPIALVLVTAGAAMAYLAGAQDAQKELAKRHQAEIWNNANHTTVGSLDDVPSQRDRDDTPGNAT